MKNKITNPFITISYAGRNIYVTEKMKQKPLF